MTIRIMKTMTLALMGLLAVMVDAPCQSTSKLPRYFGTPIVTDTLSTFFFPVEYNEELLSANKIALGGNYYANMVVYDFKADTYRKLFESDTFIEIFGRFHKYGAPYPTHGASTNLTEKWVFLLVKTHDTSGNGRIDDHDPSVLYATTLKGENLKRITKENEHVVSFEIFNKQNFALIKIQRDVNGDGSFKAQERDFYYKKIDLGDLSLGKGIEIK